MKKYTEIGNRLKELRGDLSQKGFAKKIGISYVTYQNYEYGKRVPPGPVLSKIARLFNVTTDYILTGDIESLREEVVRRKSELKYRELELARHKGKVNSLRKQVKNELSKRGLPVPDDIDGFINVAIFLGKHGVDIASLMSRPEKPSLFELDFMKEIIEAVEEVFEEKELDLPPKKKAAFITLLYEVLLKEEAEYKGEKRKSFIRDNIIKFIPVAA